MSNLSKLSLAEAQAKWNERVNKLKKLVELILSNRHNKEFLLKISERFYRSLWTSSDDSIICTLIDSLTTFEEKSSLVMKSLNQINSLIDQAVHYIGEANDFPYSEKCNDSPFEYRHLVCAQLATRFN